MRRPLYYVVGYHVVIAYVFRDTLSRDRFYHLLDTDFNQGCREGGNEGRYLLGKMRNSSGVDSILCNINFTFSSHKLYTVYRYKL